MSDIKGYSISYSNGWLLSAMQVGGATGMVGDPSGRLRERERLPEDTLRENITGITGTLTRVFGSDEQLHPIRGSELPELK